MVEKISATDGIRLPIIVSGDVGCVAVLWAALVRAKRLGAPEH